MWIHTCRVDYLVLVVIRLLWLYIKRALLIWLINTFEKLFFFHVFWYGIRALSQISLGFALSHHRVCTFSQFSQENFHLLAKKISSRLVNNGFRCCYKWFYIRKCTCFFFTRLTNGWSLVLAPCRESKHSPCHTALDWRRKLLSMGSSCEESFAYQE